MNYGKRNARKRKQELASRGVYLRHGFGAVILFAVLLIVLAGIAFLGYRGYGLVKGILAETPELNMMDVTPSGYMSTVLDGKGNVTAQLVQTGSNRVYATIDEIPENLQHAFVAIEDERFYEHNGIDVKGIVRAGLRGLASGRFDEGASTITQQLLKNNVFEGWTNETKSERVKRKLQEQFLAIQLERKADKSWIMENYLNTINLGQNTLGVQAAANRYFGKDVSDLSLSECAVIAAITQNPARYNPISHPEENRGRHLIVLQNMADQGYISDQEYAEAVADDVYSRIRDVNTELEEGKANITSYFVDALTDEVIEDLQRELGYSEAQAYTALYSGGLTIYSTQDPDIQAICDGAVNDGENYDIRDKVSFSYAISIQQADGSVKHFNEQTMLSYYKQQGERDNINYNSQEAAQAAVDEYREYLLRDGGTVLGEKITFTVQPQTALTVMDQHTGQIKAVVGGRGDKTASRTLNRATGTPRQPGSTFKILIAYAQALDSGKYTLATSVVDEPIAYANGKQVKNADGRYRGPISVREAIQDSVNVVALKTSWDITTQAGYEMARQFGITTLTDEDVVESLALGGVSRGVTPLELTAAYAAIANMGTYTEPVLYTRILDHEGNVLLEKTPQTHTVIKDTTAFLLTSAMEDVVTKGTGRLANFSGMSIAGKTGTTTASRDSWFVGYTPYYTCAVWGGYDDNMELESTRHTRLVWKSAMEKLHEGLEDPGFIQPEGVKRQTVCAQSGMLAREGVCTQVYSEYFAQGTLPEGVCDSHETAVICRDSGLLAGDYCPDTSKVTQSFAKGSVPKEVCNVHLAPVVVPEPTPVPEIPTPVPEVPEVPAPTPEIPTPAPEVPVQPADSIVGLLLWHEKQDKIGA